MLNKVLLMGRLTRDPEFRQTTSGVAVCRFSVAVDRKFANKETGERETDFIDVQAWRNTAEFLSRYFAKGSLILIEGSIRNNNWTDNEGKKHFSYVVMADSVSFGGDKKSHQPEINQTPAVPQAAPPAQQALSIGDLGDFEEILGDEMPPF